MIQDGFYNVNEKFYSVNKAAAYSLKYMRYDMRRIHRPDTLDCHSYFLRSQTIKKNIQ